MTKVCLDAGHGGSDPGAIGGGLQEKDINLLVVEQIAYWLKLVGIEVVMTRNQDVKPTNPARCKTANEAKADLYVAIHCNAATSTKARGLEILYGKGKGLGKDLAEDLLEGLKGSLIDETGVLFRKPPIKGDNELGRGSNFKLTVLQSTKMPSALVELSFISNKEDRALLMNRQDEFAQGIADGIVRALKRLGKPIAQVEPKPAPGLESGPVPVKIEDKPKPDPQVRERKDEKMSPDVTNKTTEALEIWDATVEIFKDGKIEPAEVPALMGLVANLLETVATILTLAKIDPKISAILGLLAAIVIRVADGIKAQTPKLTSAWVKIAGVLNDNKVDVKEVPLLVGGILELTQAVVGIIAPWVDAGTIGNLSNLTNKIVKVLGWLNIFGKPQDLKPDPIIIIK